MALGTIWTTMERHFVRARGDWTEQSSKNGMKVTTNGV